MTIENGQKKGNEGRSESNPENRRGLRYVLGGAVLTGALMVTGAACGGAQQAPAPETGYTEIKVTTATKMAASVGAISVSTRRLIRTANGESGAAADAEANREVAEALVEGGRAVGMTPDEGRGVTNPWNSGDAGETEDAGSEAEDSDAGTGSDGRGVTNPWNSGDSGQDAGTSESDAGESSDAGGRGATNPWSAGSASESEGQKTASPDDECATEPLAVGQEIVLGATERARYSIKITALSEDTVTGDVTMPAGIPIPAVNLITFNIRFNGVELPRQRIEALAELRCRSGGETQGEPVMSEEADRLLDALTAPGPTEETDESGAAPWLGYAIKGGLDQLLDMQRVYENPLRYIAESFLRRIERQAEFTVEESNEDEFILKIRGGEFDGRTFRLSRSISLNIEFVFETAGFFTFGQRIESLSVDAQGNVSATIGTDCSQRMEMGIFGSEHASGRPPGCEK